MEAEICDRSVGSQKLAHESQHCVATSEVLFGNCEPLLQMTLRSLFKFFTNTKGTLTINKCLLTKQVPNHNNSPHFDVKHGRLSFGKLY